MSLWMIEEEGFLIENNNKKLFEYQKSKYNLFIDYKLYLSKKISFDNLNS